MTTEESSSVATVANNPYIGTLGWSAVAGIALSVILLFFGSAMIVGAGALGSLGVLAFLFWLHASAMKWEPPAGK